MPSRIATEIQHMESNGTCTACHAKNGGAAPQWKQIGEPVKTTIQLGKGHDDTDHTFYQCWICGSVWVRYSDSGAGGHGTFYKRLTESLF